MFYLTITVNVNIITLNEIQFLNFTIFSKKKGLSSNINEVIKTALFFFHDTISEA